MPGLPDGMHACLFDLDGVLPDPASWHRRAWKTMFDEYLRTRAASTGEPFVPFDAGADLACHERATVIPHPAAMAVA